MILELQNVTKTIKGVTVLDNISLTMQGGKVYGFQGKNGSGKTMLMRLICGLIKPTSGQVIINGETLGKDISFPRSVGVLIENPSFLPECTALRNLRLLSDLRDHLSDNELKAVLFDVGLDPEDKRKYRSFSLGMKQKLGIAAAVMGIPELVILDEPINAVDDAGVGNIRKILMRLKESGSLIIVACHDREELELISDEILKIDAGRIVP
ncbi:MAG: ATP-binding cassette domain-containing protein [Oscillospiraceae bacterium]|nr:ATP-binding cassette domain-containing protein [Oscillospiraceae bacterium]